jgi:hypothetical protein
VIFDARLGRAGEDVFADERMQVVCFDKSQDLFSRWIVNIYPDEIIIMTSLDHVILLSYDTNKTNEYE